MRVYSALAIALGISLISGLLGAPVVWLGLAVLASGVATLVASAPTDAPTEGSSNAARPH